MEMFELADAAVARAIDGDLRLINEAILLVALGAAPRVIVAGLNLGDTVLDTARRLALEAGVRLVPLWTTDEQHLDVRVEAIRP